MKFYISDYLIDTQHLTTLEHGAYLLLIMTYFQSGKSLPDDDKKLSRICKLSVTNFKKIKEVLKSLFFISDGKWIHKRVEKELSELSEKSAMARSAINSRWKKDLEIEQKREHTNVIRPYYERNTNVIPSDTETDTDTESEPKPITQELTSSQDFNETKNLSVVETKEKTRAARLSVVSHPSEIEMIFAHWQIVTGKTRARLNDERKKILSQALGWGYSAEDLCRAVSGCQQTPFFQGKNDRGQTYNDIDHIFKKAKNIDMFIENFFSPPQPTDTKLDPFVEAKKRSRQNSMQRNSEVTVIEENNYHV